MQEEKVTAIHDQSEDKKYFTMIPNFVIDHAGAIPRALYMDMKRYAGEVGTCYASERTLRTKLQVGKIAFHKALKFLLDQKWVTFSGYQLIETDGGMQSIKAYTVNDIWSKNMAHYSDKSKGVLKTDDLGMLKTAGVTESADLESQRGAENGSKGVLIQATKKNYNTKKKLHSSAEALGTDPDHQNIVDIIELFKPINPSVDLLYGRPPQREAVRRLIKKYGLEKVTNMVRALPDIVIQKTAPRITTPMQLEEKLGQLILFVRQNKSAKKQIIY